MNFANNDENSELKCYIQILNYFENKDNNLERTEIWKNQALITLMRILRQNDKELQVKNAIILIISLFEGLPPDLFNNRGKDSGELTNKDRGFYLAELKQEFLQS